MGNASAGIFNIGGTSAKIIGVQAIGIVACFIWTFGTAFIMFKIIDKTVGLRVSPEEEAVGLDHSEHAGSGEAGYIYYALEGTDADTQEVFLSLGLDTFLSPSLTVYKDISEYPSWYFLLGISHAFEITEKVSLELSGSISYLLSDDADDYYEVENGVPTDTEFENFHDEVISASPPIAVTKYMTITPSLSYTFPLSSDASDEMEYRSFKGDDDNFVYGGVTLSMAF